MRKKTSTSSTLVVILTVFAVILSWYVVAPGYQEVKAEKDDLEGQIVVLQEKLNWLQEVETGLTSGEQTFNKLFVSVPSDDRDEPNAIAELEAIALKHNLVIPSISFSDVSSDTDDLDSTETYIPGLRVAISLVVEGSFADVSGLIKSVENSVKFMNIRSLTYAAGENTETNLSLEIEAYAQNIETDSL